MVEAFFQGYGPPGQSYDQELMLIAFEERSSSTKGLSIVAVPSGGRYSFMENKAPFFHQ